MARAGHGSETLIPREDKALSSLADTHNIAKTFVVIVLRIRFGV